eukprot:6086724-Amphidinium_carterae.1
MSGYDWGNLHVAQLVYRLTRSPKQLTTSLNQPQETCEPHQTLQALHACYACSSAKVPTVKVLRSAAPNTRMQATIRGDSDCTDGCAALGFGGMIFRQYKYRNYHDN